MFIIFNEKKIWWREHLQLLLENSIKEKEFINIAHIAQNNYFRNETCFYVHVQTNIKWYNETKLKSSYGTNNASWNLWKTKNITSSEQEFVHRLVSLDCQTGWSLEAKYEKHICCNTILKRHNISLIAAITLEKHITSRKISWRQ